MLTHLANDAVDVLVLLINFLAHCASKAVQTLSSAVESIEIGVNLLRGKHTQQVLLARYLVMPHFPFHRPRSPAVCLAWLISQQQ